MRAARSPPPRQVSMLDCSGARGCNATVKPRILVIGVGSIGERHLRCIQRTGRADLFACETNPALLQKITRQYQVPGFPDVSSALKTQRFDGVVVCTPANTHINIALQCY